MLYIVARFHLHAKTIFSRGHSVIKGDIKAVIFR